MKKIIFAFAFFIIYFNGSSQTNEYEYTTNHHKKQVIGYFPTWDAWKSSSDGVPQQGFYNQLNIDYSQYTILNWSFLGVAKDGSLHSGDLRNKLIYQPGQVQEPGPMFWDDIYSSWDYWLLYGELEILYHLPDNLDKNPSDPLYWVYSKYGYKGNGNSGWINTKTGTKGSYPLPLPKPGGAKGLLELGHEKGVKII